VKRFFKWSAVLIGFLAALTAYPTYRLYHELMKSVSEDPTVWEEDIRALEGKTRERGPLNEPVVFIGSSSIRFWDSLAADMQPLETIRHGFGGAKLGDIVHYAARLVNVFEPRAVVVYCGSNDIQPESTKPPEELLRRYRRFVDVVRRNQPDLPIYYIGINPTPLRWSVWPQVQATNAAIRTWTEATPGLHYIETGPAFLNDEGEPDRALFRFDRLHLNDAGYEVWTRMIRPRLLADLSVERAS
jgi:lysophospholipase L1-like esterase